MEIKFTKLSDLVGSQFTVEKFNGYKWKKWDAEAGRMLVSDDYEQGYRKIYSLDTDKGRLDVSQSQVGNMLEGVVHAGKADMVGVTYGVKSNGKTGMEIRYFINALKTKPIEGEVVEEPEGLFD